MECKKLLSQQERWVPLCNQIAELFFDRLLLAALRYNENCNRELLLDESGELKLTVSYLKYKGGKGKASKVREPPTTGKAQSNLKNIACNN